MFVLFFLLRCAVFILVFPSPLRSPKMSAEMLTRSGKRKPQSQDNEARLIVIVVCIKGHGKMMMMLLVGGAWHCCCCCCCFSFLMMLQLLLLLPLLMLLPSSPVTNIFYVNLYNEAARTRTTPARTTMAVATHQQLPTIAVSITVAFGRVLQFSSARNVCRSAPLIYWLNACKNR